MTNTEKQFVDIIKCAIGNKDKVEVTDWFGIWNLACRHRLEALIYEVIKEDVSIPKELKIQMENAYNQMIARSILVNHCIKLIEEAFNKNQIHYALLKGAILKEDYKKPFTRFMSDVDFYIKPEDRNKIKQAIESIEGILSGNESGDEQFILLNKISVEFHGRLLYRKVKDNIENYPDWNYVDEETNRLCEEGFALNLLGHVVRDLSAAGPGIRYILDLWIYRNRHKPQPNWNIVDDKLREDGIYVVAYNLLDLSEYLFGDGKENDLMKELAGYVLKGGLHGEHKRGLVSQELNNNSLIKRVFRSRTEFENRYPWLKKYPILLPVAWVMRLFKSRKRFKKEIDKYIERKKEVNESDIKDQKESRKRYGL